MSAATNRKLLTCPACHQPVIARLTLGVELTEAETDLALEQSTVSADVSVVGLAVHHDCNKMTARAELRRGQS